MRGEEKLPNCGLILKVETMAFPDCPDFVHSKMPFQICLVESCYYFFSFGFFETSCCLVAQAGLKHAVLLPPFPDT
jgi:hypothetical protein